MTNATEKITTLLVGATGMLGRALHDRLRAAGHDVVAPGSTELDLTRPETIDAGVETAAPTVVVNAAAFSDVAAAERSDRHDEVYALNRDGPAALATACAERGIAFVHVSTDYVFDGAKGAPYVEDDPTGPLQVYGASKLAGEQAVLGACPSSLVVRTSTLYGPGPRTRPHYVDAILLQVAERDVLEVVETPVSSPTHTPDLARGILELVACSATGVVHLVNAGWCSRLELARAAVELSGRGDTVEVRTRPEPPGSLRRPANSALSTARFEALTGSAPRPWRRALAVYVEGRRSTGAV